MGIYADIYRGTYDSERNRFYGKKELIIVNAQGPFTPRDGDSVAMICSNANGSVAIRPAKLVNDQWVAETYGMNGGTYASASDSRFSDAVEKILGFRFYGAVAIHDRFEDGI